MLVFYCTLISVTSIKTYFTLRSDTVSEGVACGGIGSSLLEVSEIFNNVFLVGSPYSKKNCSSGRWGAEECNDIIFRLFKKIQLNPWKRVLVGHEIECAAVT